MAAIVENLKEKRYGEQMPDNPNVRIGRPIPRKVSRTLRNPPKTSEDITDRLNADLKWIQTYSEDAEARRLARNIRFDLGWIFDGDNQAVPCRVTKVSAALPQEEGTTP